MSEIEEGNKLIAEFMELKQVVLPEVGKPLLWVQKNFKEDFAHIDDFSDDSLFDWGNFLPQTVNLYYHKSWDLLMPVIKKCKSIADPFEFDTLEYREFEDIFYTDIVIQEFFNNDIDAIHSRVVNFIKWYNEWKKEK